MMEPSAAGYPKFVGGFNAGLRVVRAPSKETVLSWRAAGKFRVVVLVRDEPVNAIFSICEQVDNKI